MMSSVDKIIPRIFNCSSILSLGYFPFLKNIFKYLMNLGIFFFKIPDNHISASPSISYCLLKLIVHLNTAKYMKHTSTLLHSPIYAKYHQTQYYARKKSFYLTPKRLLYPGRVSLSPSFLLKNYFPGYKM